MTITLPDQTAPPPPHVTPFLFTRAGHRLHEGGAGDAPMMPIMLPWPGALILGTRIFFYEGEIEPGRPAYREGTALVIAETRESFQARVAAAEAAPEIICAETEGDCG